MSVARDGIVRVIAIPKPLKSPHVLAAVGRSARALVVEMHSVAGSEPMKTLGLERRTPPRLLGYVEGQAVFMVAITWGSCKWDAASLVRRPTPNQVLLRDSSEGAVNGHCSIPVRVQHPHKMVSRLNFKVREHV